MNNEYIDMISEITKKHSENKREDTFYKSEIICPYCGFNYGDDSQSIVELEHCGKWNYRDCEHCHKIFEFGVEIEFKFSTFRNVK